MNTPPTVGTRDAVIVGAGLSGLSLAWELKRKGIRAVILEKEPEIAAPWRRRHPQLRLNTHRRLSSLPGYALPRRGPAFPSRDEIIAYLERYAAQTGANIRFGTAVKRLDRRGDDWELTTDAGPVRARNVIFATGKENTQRIPDWPGRARWRGELIHSAALGDVSRYAGMDVLVVGAGNSGSDVLNHLAGVDTRSLSVAVRQGSVVVPSRLFGFPMQLAAPIMDALPNWLVDRLLFDTERLAFGRLERFGFPVRKGGASRLLAEGVSPAIDNGFMAALRAGKASIVPAIDRFEEDAVILSEGRRLKPDIVIAATGYRTGLHGLLDHLGVLSDNGYPQAGTDGAAIGHPGLWFAGMAPRMSGYFRAASKNSPVMTEAISQRLAASPRHEPLSLRGPAPVFNPAE